MDHYLAYGLTIQSVFSLPELPTVNETAGDPDVLIRRDDLAPVSPETAYIEKDRRIEAEPNICRITFDDIGTFRIEDGARILVDPVAAATPSTKVFRRLLEGQVFGVLLHQRGSLVLHASAVAVNGRAAVFLGPTGVGKSTTAAACYSRGYQLLDDDVVAVQFVDGTPTVAPGVPELKLKPSTADRLGIETTTAAEDEGGTGKEYHCTATDEKREPKPLARCYLLRKGEELTIEEVPPADRVFSLIANTYTSGLLDDTNATTPHFRQCSRVAEQTPIQELHRTDDFSDLEEFVDLITADLQGGEPV